MTALLWLLIAFLSMPAFGQENQPTVSNRNVARMPGLVIGTTPIPGPTIIFYCSGTITINGRVYRGKNELAKELRETIMRNCRERQ